MEDPKHIQHRHDQVVRASYRYHEQRKKVDSSWGWLPTCWRVDAETGGC